MIVAPDRKLVIFTPPKCGTNTLHTVLPKFGARAVLGPQFDGGVDEHTTMLPFDVWRDLADYRFAVAIRDPYTRASSLYRHYRHYWRAPHHDFTTFLQRIVLAPRHLFFNATISSLLTPVENPLDGRRPIVVHDVVRLEQLAPDLQRLGFPVPDVLPKVHELPQVTGSEHTPTTRSLIELWAYHDFERFGYPRHRAGG